MKNAWLPWFLALVVLTACEKEEEQTAYDKINGTWNISSTSLLGANFPGNGSSLTFQSCTSGPCSGTDYNASDTTTGAFSYIFSENDKVLTITDTLAEGGNYNYQWDLLRFTDTRIRMTAETLFGNLTVEMSKN